MRRRVLLTEGVTMATNTGERLDIGVPLDDEALAWQERALCNETDPEAFFPDKGGSTRAAKRVCLSCDVRAACLQWALDHDERFGIWGGLTERERRAIKVKRRAVSTTGSAA